jgi:hypothetical protein
VQRARRSNSVFSSRQDSSKFLEDVSRSGSTPRTRTFGVRAALTGDGKVAGVWFGDNALAVISQRITRTVTRRGLASKTRREPRLGTRREPRLGTGHRARRERRKRWRDPRDPGRARWSTAARLARSRTLRHFSRNRFGSKPRSRMLENSHDANTRTRNLGLGVPGSGRLLHFQRGGRRGDERCHLQRGAVPARGRGR